MTIEEFKKTSIWSEKHDLPLFPNYNNPHVYFSYFVKYFFEENSEEKKILITKKDSYNIECAVDFGLFYRWPNEIGLETSHDELIGICYADDFGLFSSQIIERIRFGHGYYNNVKPKHESIKEFFRWNLYRFPWAIAFIKHRAHGKCNLFWQLCFLAHVILKSFQSPQKASGHLLVWLMSDEMRKRFVCRQALNIAEKIKSLSGRDYSTKNLFKIYFPDQPIWSEK